MTDDGTADKAKKARLQELMEKAITAYAKGNYLESETLAKRAMEVDPNEPAAPMLVFKARTERRFKQDLQNSDAVLSRSMDQLERELDQSARRNAEMQNHVRTIRAELKATGAGRPTGDAARAVVQFANVLKQQKAEAVDLLAGVLKRRQPTRRRVKGERDPGIHGGPGLGRDHFDL